MDETDITPRDTRTPDRHLSDGAIRAYLDGELGAARRATAKIHLRRCATCQRALDGIRKQSDHVADLLSLARARSAATRRRPAFRTTASLAAASAIGAVLTLAVYRLPATHSRTTGGASVHDVCCFNLDGGAQRDDGMLTVSRAGQVVDCVVLYEDRAGTRAFSTRDPVRFVSQPEGCDAGALVAVVGSGDSVRPSGM